jgi:hypothetical protein
MKEALVVGNRRSLLTVLAAAFGLALANLVAPSQVSAQTEFTAQPNGNEYCASVGPPTAAKPQGYVAQDPFSELAVVLEGTGRVEARMFKMTRDDCIQGDAPHVCLSQCTFRVQTVCEAHCGDHKHSPPLPWPVQLVPTADPGWHFIGWRGSCGVSKDAGRNDCIMDSRSDATVTAVFRQDPDSAPPATPTVTRATAGSYQVDLAWSASEDETWLGGYDVFVNDQLVARLSSAATSTHLFLDCDGTYRIRVVAFDSRHAVSSTEAHFRTNVCQPSVAPKPNTVIHIKTPKSTRFRGAFFHYGVKGDIPATKFQCKLDRGRWLACSGRTGKRYRNLKRGYHTFYVRAGNANGFDATPAKWRWRVR